VVIRGSSGAPRRAVNIPWCGARPPIGLLAFSGKPYGVLTGETLQDRGLPVELPLRTGIAGTPPANE
jgi:hypothetical protein